ncbi:transcription factor, partial [Marinomonas sp. 42_23_T18]
AGDILYLPPNFAHNGRALDDDCMTYSIGFRAPSMQDVLTGIRDQICEVENEKYRFSSPSDHEEPHHAEIHHSDISYLQQELKAMIDKPALLADWLGTYMSEVKYPEYHGDLNQQDTNDTLQEALKGVAFFRPGDARICYHADPESELIQLYCNGSRIEVDNTLEPLIHAICDQVEFDFSTLETDNHKDIIPMLSFLISKQGIVNLPSED